jgi:hypothetical protein
MDSGLFVAADKESLQDFYIILISPYVQQVTTCLLKCLSAVFCYVEKFLVVAFPDKFAAAVNPFQLP